jgi:hypothetical protein
LRLEIVAVEFGIPSISAPPSEPRMPCFAIKRQYTCSTS